MTPDQIINQLGIDKSRHRDLHITRMFSAFVAVSEGKVIGMTDPWMRHCPLFDMLYGRLDEQDVAVLRERIRQAVEHKIAKFGSFTPRRQLHREDVAIRCGASEMIMRAMQRGFLDAAVTVCDGAGTVIADSPALVQGVGARMNGLFYTTPIAAVIKGIEQRGGIVPFREHAAIDQIEGLRVAARHGFRRLAVTANGFMDEDISRVAAVERECGISAVAIIVCTTGLDQVRVDQIAQHADLVYSCGSGEVRTTVGRRSILQMTLAIPVFVLTKKGLGFAAQYATPPEILARLDPHKQYFVAGHIKGVPLTLGSTPAYLSEAVLPVRTNKEPH